MLTAEQIAEFEREGFVLVPGLLEPSERERYNARFLDIAAGNAPPDMTVMRDVMVAKGVVTPKTPVHGINKIMNLETDPILFDYVRHPAILAIARRLTGEPAAGEASPVADAGGSADATRAGSMSVQGKRLYTISTNVFNKPPGIDGRHPLHQDLRYFRLRPASGIVGVWTALSPCTRESGCLAVIPRSHRGPLLGHEDPDWEYVNRAFYGVADVDRDSRRHIEMAPGDTLFFHPLLVHGSGRNRTDGFRRAISVHYASAECTTPERDWKTGPHVRAIND